MCKESCRAPVPVSSSRVLRALWQTEKPEAWMATWNISAMYVPCAACCTIHPVQTLLNRHNLSHQMASSYSSLHSSHSCLSDPTLPLGDKQKA